MSRKKISTTIYVTPEQSDKLRLLHDRTKVPVAVYIREGIDLVLNHYAHLLPGQLQLDAPARRAPKENGSTRSLDHAARGSEKADKEKDKSERHVSDKAEKDRDSESDAGASTTSHSKKRDAAGA